MRFLYLTPVGYLLSTVSLLSGDAIKGVNINLKRYSPIGVRVKKLPTPNERANWFVNSAVLLFQGWYIISHNLGGDVGGGYAFVAFIYGGVSLISAIYPKVQWNKDIFS